MEPDPQTAAHDPTDWYARFLNGDIDFHCTHCDYNLRGLSGDPKRCPECGKTSGTGNLWVSPEEIIVATRRLGTSATICLAGLACLAIGACLSAITTLGIPAVVLCLFGIRRFGRTCKYDAGWLRALIKFQLMGALMLSFVFGGLFCLFPLPFTLCEQYVWLARYEPISIVILMIVIWGPAAWLIFFVLRRLHRKATEDIVPMQRKAAVEIARRLGGRHCETSTLGL